MNSSAPIDDGRASLLTGADRALLTELARLRKAPQGLRAVHVLSSVVASRQKFGKEADAANQVILSVLITGAYHKIFNLSNGDIFFIYSQVTTSAVVALCTALETSLFIGVQPHKNVYGDFGNYKIFDLSRDIGSVIDGIRSTLTMERKVVSAKNPIEVKHMEYVNGQIRGTNIRSIVFNQPIYNISHAKPSIEFLEFYTSIQKLEQLYVPDRSIAGNPWLFNLIKRELDAAVMRAISNEIPSYRHKAFSLNLLVDSFMSDGFREFLGSLPVKLAHRIYVEIEKADLVQHSDFLDDIYERAESLSVPLCIDSVSYHDVELLRLSRLKFSFVKLKWTPEILKLPDEKLSALLSDLNASSAKIVLTRCDTAKSLSFARSAGIGFIQGYLADEFFKSGETLS
jgi:EAL domain-containing protein (putative c-di-GMP-specific phosphodiesterase class I)